MKLTKKPTKYTLYLLILFLVFIQFSCSDSVVSPSYETTYNYKAYDNAGKLGVTGFLTIDFKDTPELLGRWEFSSEDDSLEMGAQVGEGQLEGTVQGDTLWIDLHPGYADHNIIFNGKIEDDIISGQWSWITTVGIPSQGTFVATKK